MKKSIQVLFVMCLAVLLNRQVASQQPVPVKIVVIAFEACVMQTNEFQTASKAIQNRFQPKGVELKALSDQIDKLKSQLQAGNLSEQDKSSLTSTIAARQTELSNETDVAKKDFQAAMQKSGESIEPKVLTSATSYAKTHGFTVILDADNNDTNAPPTVLWASSSSNITKAVLDAYNGTPSALGAGQTAPMAVPAKIALINFQTAVTATSEFKSTTAELQGKWTGSTDPKAREHYGQELQDRYNALATKFFTSTSAFIETQGYTILIDKPGTKLTNVLWSAPGVSVESLNTAGDSGLGTDITIAALVLLCYK